MHHPLKYFSIWTLLSTMIAGYHPFLTRFVMFNMTIMCAGGLYITYIHPRSANLFGTGIVIRDKWLAACDLVSHHIPFAIYLYHYPLQPLVLGELIGFCWLIALYLYFVHEHDIYLLHYRDLVRIGYCVFLFWLLVHVMDCYQKTNCLGDAQY